MGVARRAAVLAVAFVLAGCGASATPTPTRTPTPTPTPPSTGGAGSFGLPFAAGTMVRIGSYALHAGNFGSVDGGANGVIRFDGAGSTAASLDLLVDAETAVHPVAAGTVLGAWPLCDVVVVDHGNGTWAEGGRLGPRTSVAFIVAIDNVGRGGWLPH